MHGSHTALHSRIPTNYQGIIYFYELQFQKIFMNLMTWEIIMGNNNSDLTFSELPVI